MRFFLTGPRFQLETKAIFASREARLCYLGTAAPPCDTMEQTSEVFLLQTDSAPACIGETGKRSTLCQVFGHFPHVNDYGIFLI